MNRRTKIILCIAAAVVALGVTLYPLISNYVNEKYRSLVQTKYENAVEKLDDTEIVAARKAAQDYNATLTTDPDKAFTKATMEQAAVGYDELLDIRGDGIMGYVEIPKINVTLPIYHGTEESSLERGAGHLLGSSLPVGGIGTHCVITGHSGLSGQKLFSDLEQLGIGDVFYLRVLNETLAYMVLDINKVLPEDPSELVIDSGRDSCTLLTCTPFAVNTHRLLVRGERIEYTTAERIEERQEEKGEETASTWTDEYMHGIVYGIFGISAIFLIVKIIRTAKETEQEPNPREVYLNTNWHRAKKKPKRAKQPKQAKPAAQPGKRGKHEAHR